MNDYSLHEHLGIQSVMNRLHHQAIGQWYRTTNQSINTVGGLTTATIHWTDKTAWTDTSAISQDAPSGSAFTVNKRGVYRLNLQIHYNNLSSATFSDRTFRAYIVLVRKGTSAVISQANVELTDATPNNAGVSTGVLFELQVGDQLIFQTNQSLSTGSFVVAGQASGTSSFDLNTTWTWELVKTIS